MSFPIYYSMNEAQCFKCSRPLEETAPSGYPTHCGAWHGYCPACYMFTWFDVKADHKHEGVNK